MKTIVAKNCAKKIAPKKQKEIMIDLGKNSFIKATPKHLISLCKSETMKKSL